MAVDAQRSSSAEANAQGKAVSSSTSTLRGAHGRKLRHRGAAVGATAQVADEDPVKKPTLVPETDDASIGDDTQEIESLLNRAALLLETPEAQASIIALIAFDLVSTVASLLLRSHHKILELESIVQRSASKKNAKIAGIDLTVVSGAHSSVVVQAVLRLLDSLAGFTIVFFTIELAVLVFTFRRRFFTHFGYVLDLLVVTTSVVLEVYTESSAARLLGIMRVWRVFRLIGTLLDREQKEHELTIEALEIEKTRVLQLQYEKQAADDSLQRELESRAGMERMLQGYKDEADTLREALTIAAQAVAEATMHTSIPEGDEEAAEVDADVNGSGVEEDSYHDQSFMDTYFFAQTEQTASAPEVLLYDNQEPGQPGWWDPQDASSAVATGSPAEDDLTGTSQERDGDDDAEFADARVE